jgi:hypothetical protein
MHPDELLKCWEQRWGQLDASLRERFLDRNEIGYICEFPLHLINEGLRQQRRLVDVLDWLRREHTPITNGELAAPAANLDQVLGQDRGHGSAPDWGHANPFGGEEPEPEEVLREWSRVWGRLSETHASSFLARPELGTLCRYPEEFVFAAVRSERRLADALVQVRKWLGTDELIDIEDALAQHVEDLDDVWGEMTPADMADIPDEHLWRTSSDPGWE